MSKKAQDYQYAHSIAKVHFYETFLNKYLRMLLSMPNIDEVHIYDVFCGRGIYTNGHKGSALHALDVINTILREKSKAPHVTLHLNDINTEHTEAIRNYIERQQKEPLCQMRYTNVDASEWLHAYRDEWILTHNYRVRNIMFIDPYGYKQIDPQVLRDLVLKCHADVLLFLPISFMYRFTQYAFNEDANNGAKPLRAFIETFFDEEHPIRTSSELNVRQYIDYLTDAFSFNNECYSASYHIERDKHNYFSLFYMSKSLMGFEKIIEAKWDLDEENGCGFTLPKQMRSLFEEQWKFERKNEMYYRLHFLLVSLFSKMKNATNAIVYKYILQHEFLPRHAKLVLSEMQTRGEIECVKIDTGEIAPKGSFYLNYRYYAKPCVIIAYNR